MEFARPEHRTRRWVGDIKGEHYELKDQGASDIAGYDVVKDIHRVEQFISVGPGADGAVILLTDDAYYWKRPPVGDTSNAAAFRLGEGVVFSGPRAWGPSTGPGSMKDRESALDLQGRYELRWRDYSILPGGGPAAAVRQLVIPIGQ